MKKRITIKGLWSVLKDSFSGFSNDKVTKLSGSLAYSTIFSFGPLLIVIIYLCSIFFGRDAVEGRIYGQLTSFVGSDAAAQLQSVIKNASINGKGGIAVIIGVVALVVGATTVFSDMQDSINQIWNLKAKPKLGLMKIIQTRLLSFSLIISLGFLLLVSLTLTTVVEALGNRLRHMFPDVAVAFFYVFNLLLTFAITTVLFGTIFKVLPDAKIKWKDIIAGAIATALLFMLGKFLISIYISQAKVGSTYGAAGSLAILLVWIYYSAIILYFGAEFTKNYAIRFGSRILPNDYAVTTQQVQVETGKKSLQQNEKLSDHLSDHMQEHVQKTTNQSGGQ